MTTKDLSQYRARAELLIHKAGLVLITVNDFKGGVWHGLPGGGVDDGETPEQAAVREALEEVGVRVKNVRYSGEMGIKEGYASRVLEREKQYKGSYTLLFEADYDRIDTSVLNKDGDRERYEWMKPEKAIALIEPHVGKNGGSGGHQLIALRRLIK